MQITIKQDAAGAVLLADAGSQEPLIALSAQIAGMERPQRRVVWETMRDYAQRRLDNLDRVEVEVAAQPKLKG